MKAFDELLEIMHRLRMECPWDREQTLLTLRPFLIEEAYECLEAMNGADEAAHMEELGDLLLQIVFQAELLSEQNQSDTISKIIEGLKQKLIRRHPHVFLDSKLTESKDVVQQWDEIKKTEKGILNSDSLLKGISKSLTSLQLAQKLGERSKKANFDWETSSEVWQQVLREIDELKSAKDAVEKEQEIGDVLFSLVQWCRHEKIDAEVALAGANSRFQSRFKKMEASAAHSGKAFKDIPPTEKEELWALAKKS
jgi:tetrapyrrole methylase family protein/MazG family protein